MDNNSLAFLRLVGYAEPFEDCGVYHVNIRWKAGQYLSEATQTTIDYEYVGK